MKYLSSFKKFESLNTDDILSNTDTILSKLPDDFRYSVKIDTRSRYDRVLSRSLNTIPILIIKIFKDINTENKYFKYTDISKIIDELIENLNDFSITYYDAYTSKNFTYSSKDISQSSTKEKDIIKLEITLRNNLIPSFKSVKSDTDNELNDIWLEVFENSYSEINIKHSKNFIKIMSIPIDNNAYRVNDFNKKLLIESIIRTEKAYDCSLLCGDINYRDYKTKSYNYDYKLVYNSFVDRKTIVEFLEREVEIPQFTFLFKIDI
jgi:hypothetical protein